MTTNRVTFSWGYWFLWGLATLLGAVVAFWVWFIVLTILNTTFESLPNSVDIVLASLVLAATYGTVIGLAQRSVLRRRAPMVRGWVWATMGGVLLAGPLVVLGSGWFSPYSSITRGLITAGGVGLALGIVQWYAMREEVQGAPVWIGLSLLAWLAGGWLGYLLWISNLQLGAILYWISMYFLGTVFSAAAMARWLKPAAAPATEPEPGQEQH